VGGVDLYVHKYLGPVDPLAGESTPGVPNQSTPIGELGIQDVILMENRDRHYAPDIYVMRGIYQMQDLDFNLSQFGIFLNNDTIFMHLHLRNCVDTLGRKIMAGDVLELPHLKDEYALDDASVALKRFYVVQDVTRAASGFSQTWYPHLLRVKCVPLIDSQEYAEIFDQEQVDSQGNATGSTLRDLISTYNQNIAVNEAIVAQAEEDAALSGYDTHQMYVVPQGPDGKMMLEDTSMTDIDASNNSIGIDASDTIEDTSVLFMDASNDQNVIDASYILKSPNKNLYVGYLTGDDRTPNGAPYGFGITFPPHPIDGQFHLRTDYFPNRLFRFNGANWMMFEENVRMTLTNKPKDGKPDDNINTRQTQRTGFINNSNTATIAGEIVQERQALSKALKPRADN
jgi:hypothetical protein